MAYSVATWSNTPDTWEHEFELAKRSFLIKDGSLIKKPTMSGLEIVESDLLSSELFELHGTEDLSEIIGRVNKDVDMIYIEDLDSKKLYGYELVGYTDLSLASVSGVIMKNKDGEYFTFTDGELIKIEQPLTEDKIIGNPIDLEQLTGTTNKEMLTMDIGAVEGIGKIYSKKISPMNWKRKIEAMDVIGAIENEVD